MWDPRRERCISGGGGAAGGESELNGWREVEGGAGRRMWMW